MLRWMTAGALAAVAIAGVGSQKAGAAASPFAGVYSGVVPQPSNEWTWEITISNTGAVKGSYYYGDSTDYYRGSLSGKVSDAGSISIKGSDTAHVHNWYDGSGDLIRYRGSFAITGTVALDANGDLDTSFELSGNRGAITWYRQ
jgi:hypothetical protein